MLGFYWARPYCMRNLKPNQICYNNSPVKPCHIGFFLLWKSENALPSASIYRNIILLTFISILLTIFTSRISRFVINSKQLHCNQICSYIGVLSMWLRNMPCHWPIAMSQKPQMCQAYFLKACDSRAFFLPVLAESESETFLVWFSVQRL